MICAAALSGCGNFSERRARSERTPCLVKAQVGANSSRRDVDSVGQHGRPDTGASACARPERTFANRYCSVRVQDAPRQFTPLDHLGRSASADPRQNRLRVAYDVSRHTGLIRAGLIRKHGAGSTPRGPVPIGWPRRPPPASTPGVGREADFRSCPPDRHRPGRRPEHRAPSTMLLLDGSSSMWGQIDGQARGSQSPACRSNGCWRTDPRTAPSA
jgi:hypothetical protein